MEKIDFGKFLTKDSIVVLLGKDKKSVFDQLVAQVSDRRTLTAMWFPVWFGNVKL